MSGAADASGQSLSVFIRDKLAIATAATLLLAASTAWIASYYLMPSMKSGSSDMMGAAGIVSSPSIASVFFFEAVWVVGMVAMMFPAMIPMVIFYNRFGKMLEPNVSLARVGGSSLFLAGYIATYALLGVGTYLAVFAGLYLGPIFPFLSAVSPFAPSAILIAAGTYQFSSLKTRCVVKCVSPLGFFATRSGKGLTGAFRMGLSHGKFCVGCCWAYMLVMLAVGAMSIPVMAVFAGLVALEKVVVKGSSWFNTGVALALVFLGVFVAVTPGILTAA